VIYHGSTDEPEGLAEAIEAFGRGEIVGYPTETYYGLGVDALDPAALARLLELKGRGADKAVSVLVTSEAMLERLCTKVPATAHRLMAAYWPGALTIALPARAGLPAALLSDGCVAVRHSPHPVASAFVAAVGRPITATSANPAGAAPPTTAAEVRAYFAGRCVVIDGGATAGGAPSTLVRVRNERIEILRHGAVEID